LKLVCVSDTHGMLHTLNIPEGDVLVIAVDVVKQMYDIEVVNVARKQEMLDAVREFINGL